MLKYYQNGLPSRLYVAIVFERRSGLGMFDLAKTASSCDLSIHILVILLETSYQNGLPKTDFTWRSLNSGPFPNIALNKITNNFYTQNVHH